VLFNSIVGGYCAYKMAPIQREAALSYPIFRKPWMQIPIKLTVFASAYYMSNQFQTRFFPKMSWKYWKHAPGGGFSGIKAETYLNNHDLISRFRFFE
jgi:hypothetical protein